MPKSNAVPRMTDRIAHAVAHEICHRLHDAPHFAAVRAQKTPTAIANRNMPVLLAYLEQGMRMPAILAKIRTGEIPLV